MGRLVSTIVRQLREGKTVDEIVNHFLHWTPNASKDKIKKNIESMINTKSAAGRAFDEAKHKRDARGRWAKKEGVRAPRPEMPSDETFLKPTEMPDPQKAPFREPEWNEEHQLEIERHEKKLRERYGDLVDYFDPVEYYMSIDTTDEISQAEQDYNSALETAANTGNFFDTWQNAELGDVLTMSDELFEKYNLPKTPGEMTEAHKNMYGAPLRDFGDTEWRVMITVKSLNHARDEDYPRFVDLWHDVVQESPRLMDHMLEAQAYMNLFNKSLYDKWENGHTLYRNTTIEELDHYIENYRLGSDENSYNYVAMSPSSAMGKTWKTSRESTDRIMIEYDAEALRRYSAPVRYTLLPKQLGISRSITGREDFSLPMGAQYYGEQEVRVEEGVMVDGKIGRIHFLDMGEQYYTDGSRIPFEERYKKLEEKYGELSDDLRFYDDGLSADSDEHAFETFDDYLASVGRKYDGDIAATGVRVVDHLLSLLNNLGAAGKRKFDENKHKRDIYGRWAKKDAKALLPDDTTHKSPKMTLESLLEQFPDKGGDFDDFIHYYKESLDNIMEELDRNANELEAPGGSMSLNLSFMFDKQIVGYEDISWNEFKQFITDDEYRQHRIFNSILANRQEDLVKKYPAMKKYVQAYNMVQTKMDEAYERKYNDAEYLYRGTSLDELESISEYGIGPGGDFNYANFSVDQDIARSFTHWNVERPIVMRVNKEHAKPYTTSQGYTLAHAGDAKDEAIDSKQGWRVYHEQEHRVMTQDPENIDFDIMILDTAEYSSKTEQDNAREILKERFPFVKTVGYGEWGW